MEETPRRPWWRKKRWLATVAAAAALGYPLSFVPACWVLMRVAPLDPRVPDGPRSYDVLRATYRPVAAALKACPKPVREAVRRAAGWGAPDGRSLSVRSKIGVSRRATPDVDGSDGFVTLIVW